MSKRINFIENNERTISRLNRLSTLKEKINNRIIEGFSYKELKPLYDKMFSIENKVKWVIYPEELTT